MTPLYHGTVLHFKARTAWKAYQENRRLAALRDSLLSRLMSGDVDVSVEQL